MAQSNHGNKVVDTIMALLQDMVNFAPRLPREGGSITPIQAHVTNTKLGHRRPN